VYGLVNKGLADMVRSIAGDSVWDQIKVKAGVSVDVFISKESYPDAMTVSLVVATAEALATTPDDILERFGQHWVLETAQAYGHLLEATGRTLPEFLRNLPNLHTRIALSFPYLDPPTFRCSAITESSLVLGYSSRRTGLIPFVVGLIKGLGQRFDTPLRVTLLPAKPTGEQEFLIDWGSTVSSCPS